MAAPIGNTNATKGKLVSDAMRKVAVQQPEKLVRALERQLSMAEGGDIGSMVFIRDTLDGRPHQSSDISVSGSLQDVLSSIVTQDVPE